MSESEVAALIAQLESFPRPEDRVQRQRLWEAARSFSAKVENEYILQHRILSAPLQLVIPRIASDLHIFEILVESKKPISTSDLAKRANASELLLGRILRYLASQLFIVSPAPQRWEASTLTPFLANPGYAAGLRFGTSCVLPSALATPSLLASNSYKDTSMLDITAFQAGKSTSDSMFGWLAKHPDVEADFQEWMAETHRRQKSAFDVLRVDQLMQVPSPDVPVFVDVGGGNGRSCAELLERHPELACRIINQDIQATKAGLPIKAVEHQDYDFFTEQPVVGAKVYHFRNILHNWSDDECVALLSQTRRAMNDSSVILVDDIAIDESDVDWYACYVDLVMGMFFGSRERTIEEYKSIFGRSGLALTEAVRYMEGSGEHIMVLAKSMTGEYSQSS